MTSGIFVTYDTTTLSPTPLVNYSHQPINFGYVYGYNTDITLDGLYTGITTTGAAISYLTGVFGNQFKGLTVTDNIGNTLYQWTGITVDSINLESSSYFQGNFIKYSIRLKSFDFPSGIIEPSNEYSFVQNDDGTVNVNHKISARGVRNSYAAFQNAINFVQQFTGKDPFSNCAPFLVPAGSGVLLSANESINRADAIYSVNEVYRYKTGVFVPYVKTTSLEISDVMDADYRAIDYNVKFQGSPIQNNIASIINSNLSYNLLSDIQNEFGFTTTGWVKNTYTVNVDSGAALVDIKVGYVSGASPYGFFDYNVTCDQNYLQSIETWRIEGEFRCYGPLDYKRNQLTAFKNANNNNNWRTYLSGVILSSPIYASHHNASVFLSPNCETKVEENTNLAQLKLSMNMDAGYEPIGLDNLKYSIEGVPSKWLYELLPSATIEGSFVIQNLQAKSNTKQKISLEGTTNNKTGSLVLLAGYLSSLKNFYVVSGNQNAVTAFLTDEQISTGVFTVSHSASWLGLDNGISSGILSLQAIGTSNASVPVRTYGYNFGY